MDFMTILWREFVFFKRRFFKITTAAIVSPLLYLFAFGWGLGDKVVIDGFSYIFYLIPGIVALTTMRGSYGAVSMRVSVARLHEKSFEHYLLSPTNLYMLTFGHVLSGALRGMYTASLILLITFIFGYPININFAFVLVCFLNSLLFAGMGFFAAMMIDTHYDMNRFSSFIITPMAFLCGTFFSLNKLPWIIRRIIEMLPLTHATRALRSIALSGRIEYFSILVVLFYAIVLYILSVKSCYESVQ